MVTMARVSSLCLILIGTILFSLGVALAETGTTPTPTRVPISNTIFRCPTGMKIETIENSAQCRNPICDEAPNLYGLAKDRGQTVPVDILLDEDGQPRPVGKTLDGKSWVGWTTGGKQCPPDILDFHPNPLWKCGFDYCLVVTPPAVVPPPPLPPKTDAIKK